MSDNPDAIRSEIEETRARLGTNVDALADKVTPSNVIHRQTDKVKGTVMDAVTGVKDKVMGAADSATSSVGDKMTAVQDKVSSGTSSTGGSLDGAKDAVAGRISDAGTAISAAPNHVKTQAQGNPLAAGLIAFGAGMLVSALIPATSKERQAAQQLKTAAEPLTTELAGAAKEMAENLKEPVQEAMESVKATAADAAQNVKAEGQGAVSDVKDRTVEGKDNLHNN